MARQTAGVTPGMASRELQTPPYLTSREQADKELDFPVLHASSHGLHMVEPLASSQSIPCQLQSHTSSLFHPTSTKSRTPEDPTSISEQAMIRALSTSPPSWFGICSLVQESHGINVLHDSSRGSMPVSFANLNFSYDRPSALHLAVLYNKPAVVALLLVRGVDVNVRTACGRTALFTAVDAWPQGKNRSDVFELLVKFGADAQLSDKLQNTPLTAAVLQQNAIAAERLIQLDANVNAKSNPGWTALHEAAWQGSVHLVELLLKHGASPGLLTADGKSATDLALEGRFNLVALHLSEHKTVECNLAMLQV